MSKAKAYVAWSSGKDSAYALHQVRRSGEVEIVGLLTTTNETFNRVAMHGVRDELLDRQAAALGLPCLKVKLPWPCTNDIYEARMAEACERIKKDDVRHIVFGDLFLEDLRAWREQKLAETGMTGLFPLWKRDTAALAREMLDAGMVAHLACIDLKKLDRSFAGRRFDAALLGDLPAGIDPCGENGEFHTVVSAGPMFSRPISIQPGEIVERDGFVFADFIPSDG